MKQTFLQSCATAVILLILPFTANAQNSKDQNKTAQTVKDQTIDTLAVQGFDKVIKAFNTAVNTQDKSKSRDYKLLAKEYNNFYAKYNALPERIKNTIGRKKDLTLAECITTWPATTPELAISRLRFPQLTASQNMAPSLTAGQ